MAIKHEQLRDDWTVADPDVTYTFLSGQNNVDADRVGILGHCWGGRVAWVAACHNAKLKGCAIFYGGRIKLPFSDGSPAPIALADQITCPVLGIFGNEDQNPSPEDVDDYESILNSAEIPNTFHRYDGAGHEFLDHTNRDRYREAQSEDAWTKSITFFNTQLK